MSKPTPPTYKTKSWPAYDEALQRRGLLAVWFDPKMNWDANPTGKRGRARTFSDAAIQTVSGVESAVWNGTSAVVGYDFREDTLARAGFAYQSRTD